EQLEAARQLLRKGDDKQALERLAACQPEFHDDEQFTALRSYAYERYARSPRWVVVQRIRLRRSEGAPIDGAVLQRVLCWLGREELDAGADALYQGRFRAAASSFAAAGLIDERCNVAAYLHALSLVKHLQQAFQHDQPPSLEQAHSDLTAAAGLVDQASHDPELRERSL